MKLVEASGNARTIGRITGEELREEIREHVEMYPPGPDAETWEKRWPAFSAAMQEYLPLVLEEIEGTAEGADVPIEVMLKLNMPQYNNDLDFQQGCTNLAFAAGPDGPIWGKNNDGGAPGEQRPPCARLIRRDDGIPHINFTFCGMVATLDAMNAEGVAVGHSSVGSDFQQSDHLPPIRLWGYEGMMRCRTTAEFVRHMTALPTRGKGYASVVADASGALCSLEQPCPLTQVRLPEPDADYINCSNYYQLPALAGADRRDPDGKRNAIARAKLLDDRFLGNDKRSLGDMKEVLRYHGDPSICCHGVNTSSHTEYSMIGLCESAKVLFLHGYPCEEEYVEVQL